MRERTNIALTIETKRLLLRPFEMSDLDDHAIGTGSLTKEETKQRLVSTIEAWDKQGFGAWAVIYKASRQIIGRAGLAYLDDTADIHVGFVLEKAFWGTGLGREAAQASINYAFKQLNLNKLFTAARATNASSRKLLERLGFRFARNANYYGHPAIIYVMHKHEWEKAISSEKE
jgi:ribosomal-protein-alanine N-acetyltransferase